MKILLLFLALLLLDTACVSLAKVLNQREKVADLVTEEQAIFFAAKDGFCRINSNGTGRRVLVDPAYGVWSHSRDGGTFALGDNKDWNLYVLAAGDKAVRRVPEFDGETARAEVSPDGSRIAAWRSLWRKIPQRDWGRIPYDDSFSLIDPATLAIKVVPKKKTSMIHRMDWALDGKTLWIELADGSIQSYDPAKGRRQDAAEWPAAGLVRSEAPSPCEGRVGALEIQGKRAEKGIAIKRPDGSHALVVTNGKTDIALYGDPGRLMHTAFYTPSCRYVIFDFDNAVWAADLASGKVGVITAGWRPELVFKVKSGK
jgi:hypothetical protein